MKGGTCSVTCTVWSFSPHHLVHGSDQYSWVDSRCEGGIGEVEGISLHCI